MSNQIDDNRNGSLGRVTALVWGIAGSIRIDLTGLYTNWVSLMFSRGLQTEHSVVEYRKKGSTRGVVGYWLWGAVGVCVLTLVYPLVILGLATRFYSRRIDRVSAGLGFLGVVLVSLVVWGALSVATYLSPIAYEGFLSVAIAGVVATASAAVAMYFTRKNGRVWTVAVGYPLGATAIFLPPVVASLYSPTLASMVFPRSESLAIWLLDNVFVHMGLAGFIRRSFELEGVAYVGMWFGLAVPIGWILGSLVTLAHTVRQSTASHDVVDSESGSV